MGLDLDFNNVDASVPGNGANASPQAGQRLASAGSSHALPPRPAGRNGHCGHAPDCRAVAPAFGLATLGEVSSALQARRFLALGAVESLGEVADRGLQASTCPFKAASRSTSRACCARQ